jgi:Ser/Thr protein kinase RdoA (MazF antagonist)
MDFNEQTVLEILKCWLTTAEIRDFRISNVSGGLSGAQLWRVALGEKTCCLRRWPTVRPTEQQLNELHALITHVWNGGFVIVPLPQLTQAGQSFVHFAGHLWELANWLPGKNAENFSTSQIDAALTALAQFHQAAASHTGLKSGPAPGLLKRRTILQQLRAGGLKQLEQATRGNAKVPIRDIASSLLADLRLVLPTAIQLVEKSSTASYPLQWCLRDIHRGNLLFTNDRVSGLVDFGAAGIDSVAGDIARLVGSIAGDDTQVWQTCLATYKKNHALSQDELGAIMAYDVGGLVASSANWLRWLIIERREFADSKAVQTRLSELAKRLRSLAERGGRSLLAASQGVGL